MARRKEQKERLREERLRREEQAAAAAQRRRRLIGLGAAGVMVAVAAVVVVIAVASGGGGGGGSTSSKGWPKGTVPARKTTDLATAAKAAGCKISNPPSEGRGHVTSTVHYKTNPPTSGSHYPVPASDGAYRKQPRIEKLVHALEHGRVIYWFRPNAAASTVGALKALYDQDPSLVVLTVDSTGMPYEVAASAWTHLLGCPSYNDRVPDALRAFRDKYRNQGPEYIPTPE